MTPSPRRLRRSPALLATAALAGLVATSLPAFGQSAPPPAWTDYGFQGEGEARVDDVDARAGALQPTGAQREVAARLGADDARWNRFGTPHVLFNRDGYLSGAREGAAADVARAFVRDNAALFRLDTTRVDALELLNDSPLYDSPDLGRVYREQQPAANPDVPHVVLFRQRFGDLVSALDGLLTVGVQRDGRVAWVSSSVTGDATVSGAQRLSPAAAVAKAAEDVDLDLGDLTEVADPTGRFVTFRADGSPDLQRARLVALPTPTDGVRRAYEVTLLSTELDEHGNPTAFQTFVDAESGKVWQRQNKLEHLAQGAGPSTVVQPAAAAGLPAAAPSGGQYSGSTVPAGCGPLFPFEVTAGNGNITVTVVPTNPEDTDVVLNLIFNGTTVASQDVLNQPEVLVYAPAGGVPVGKYSIQVCPFAADAPAIGYFGTYSATPGTVPGSENGALVELPTYKVFPANPNFVTDAKTDDDNLDTRVLWCWDSDRSADCVEEQRNTASRFPWDVNRAGSPTFTTDGNNASTAVSQASFLTPDTAANRPVDPNRSYDYPWDNSWFKSSCNPSNFGTVVDDRNDEAAATTNLFVQHNRMHDWSYYLGLTEVNYNLQQTNFGNTGPDRENDPELGSSQAGRTTVNGRDNANQITLQDGIAPITNQYLWQPIAGAFYAPCVDGAYDQAVVAHEYGHAITNRLVGGPDGGTGATQGQTESWSDLQFAAYFTEFAISAGEGVNPYVLGPYVTGDPVSGIRNYAMNASPLNYSDLDYDGNGIGSPHANGEIWSATNFDILAAMNRKYDAQFPSSDKVLQNRCARGELPADECPGNRRWNQVQYDSFLLQPSGVTMIDSRDAMLAADLLRFDGADQDLLWDAFARRGLGETAKSTGPADVDAVAGWESPRRNDESLLTFRAPAGIEDLQVFVGRFEARATPVTDTDPETSTDADVLMLPGTYEFIARAPGAGMQRFTLTIGADQRRTIEVPMRRNVASVAAGATITGDGVNLEKLIDDTEATTWASTVSAGTASAGKGEGQQVEGRQVTVDLAGDAPVTVSEIQVSALQRGPVAPMEDQPADPDPAAGNRFSALRSFDLLTCNQQVADCAKPESFVQVFASADDAFPAGRPRPRVQDMILRPFDVRDSAATHVKLVVRDNQCTGAPVYQGEANPDNDPAFNPDCDTTAASPDRRLLNPPEDQVRAAELQVFSAGAPAPKDVPSSGLVPQARSLAEACPDGEGGVPRDSRQDDNGNVHEFAIDCMVWYEIAKGTSDTLYEPSRPVTRQQMAGFIARLIRNSGGALTEGPNAFTDDEGSTFEADINALAAAGIVNGKGAGRYDPSGTVTRDQMATFIVRAYEFRSSNVLPTEGDYFRDDNGNTHEANINKAADAGLTTGRGGGYDPRGTVNRDAMASFLARTLSLLVDEGTAMAKGSDEA